MNVGEIIITLNEPMKLPKMKTLKALKIICVIISLLELKLDTTVSWLILLDFRYSRTFNLSSKNVFILVALNFNKSYFSFLNNFLSMHKCLNVFKSLSLTFIFSRTLPSKLFFARSQIANKSHYFQKVRLNKPN